MFNFFFSTNLTKSMNMNFNDLTKLSNFISQFNSYESFYEFMMILKALPTIDELEDLTKSNKNLYFFEFLQTEGYFKLHSPINKYNLFVSACLYGSVDIAMLIFENDVDLESVKGLMLNYLSLTGTETDYIIFKKIWEKNQIYFNEIETETLFFSILKSSNIEFIKWFYSLDLIDFSNIEIKNKIITEIISFGKNKKNFLIDLLFYAISHK